MQQSPHFHKLNNKYILFDLINTSSMTEFYLGMKIDDKDNNSPMVIKKLLPRFARNQQVAEKFFHKARLASLLRHQNIIRIYDYGKQEALLFTVMEYLTGQTLATAITQLTQQQVYLLPEISLYIALSICNGMDYAHEITDTKKIPLNLVHGNISPCNIFLTCSGDVKILNFDSIKKPFFSNNPEKNKKTLNYMSPEQVLGNMVDRRSDIFSIGILLYEMLSQDSFYNGSPEEIIRKAAQAAHKPLEEITPNLPTGIYTIINKAVQPKVEKRYQSCYEMGEDLKRCLETIKPGTSNKALEAFFQHHFSKKCDKEKETIKDTIALAARQTAPHLIVNPLDSRQAIKEEAPSIQYAQKNTPSKSVITKQQKINPKAPMKPADIPIKDSPLRTPKKNSRQINIADREQPAPRRARSKKNIYKNINFFGLLLLVILLLTAATAYFLIDQTAKHPKDYFTQVSPPSLPPTPDTSTMTQAQREVLILKLLLQGEFALDHGKLLSPSDKNAFIFISQARQLAPQDKTVQKQAKQLVQQLTHLAEVAIQQGEKNKAAELIVAGLSIAPENPELKALKQELSN